MATLGNDPQKQENQTQYRTNATTREVVLVTAKCGFTLTRAAVAVPASSMKSENSTACWNTIRKDQYSLELEADIVGELLNIARAGCESLSVQPLFR